MHFKLLCTTLILFSLAALMPKKQFHYANNNQTLLAHSYLLGQKQGLSTKLKNAHQKLHLLHMMTPSGLHLGVLMVLFKKIFKGKILTKALLIFITLGSVIFGDFHALRRMAIFGLSKNIFITFIIDLFLGGWSQSPFSYCLSFLFISIIINDQDKPKKILARDFFIAQIIISYFFNQQVHPLGFILGFFLTPLLSFLLPFFIIDLPFQGFHPVSSIISEMILAISTLTTNGISPLVGLFILFFSQLPYGGLILFLFWPSTIQDFPHHLWNKKAFHSPPPKDFETIKQTAYGVKLEYSNGMICRRRLYSTGWSTRCKL